MIEAHTLASQPVEIGRLENPVEAVVVTTHRGLVVVVGHDEDDIGRRSGSRTCLQDSRKNHQCEYFKLHIFVLPIISVLLFYYLYPTAIALIGDGIVPLLQGGWIPNHSIRIDLW